MGSTPSSGTIFRIHSQCNHREAERIADDSLAGKILHGPDAHGLVPGMLDEIAPKVIADVPKKQDTATDRAKSTHSELTPARHGNEGDQGDE